MTKQSQNLVIASVFAAYALLAQVAHAADPTYLQVSGINGEMTQAGREGWFEVYGWNHEVVSPRDAATGLPTGKRQHRPFRMVLLHSDGIVDLIKAMVDNTSIPKTTINLWRADSTGAEQKYFQYELQNVRVTSVRPWQPNKADRAAADYPQMVEISFTYQKIIWSNGDGSVVAEDTWSN